MIRDTYKKNCLFLGIMLKLPSIEDIDYIGGNMVFHYTCNSPKEKTLKRLGIEAIGEKYGRKNREVLVIPIKWYKEFGLEITDNKENLRLTSEILLRKISERFD